MEKVLSLDDMEDSGNRPDDFAGVMRLSRTRPDIPADELVANNQQLAEGFLPLEMIDLVGVNDRVIKAISDYRIKQPVTKDLIERLSFIIGKTPGEEERENLLGAAIAAFESNTTYLETKRGSAEKRTIDLSKSRELTIAHKIGKIEGEEDDREDEEDIYDDNEEVREKVIFKSDSPISREELTEEDCFEIDKCTRGFRGEFGAALTFFRKSSYNFFLEREELFYTHVEREDEELDSYNTQLLALEDVFTVDRDDEIGGLDIIMASIERQARVRAINAFHEAKEKTRLSIKPN